eukprot:768473-Hanusia_phi.AAC.20
MAANKMVGLRGEEMQLLTSLGSNGGASGAAGAETGGSVQGEEGVWVVHGTEDDESAMWVVDEAEPFTIGRSSLCNVMVDDQCKSVSKVHVTIRRRKVGWEIRDCSSCGTYVGTVLLQRRAMALSGGDTFHIGGSTHGKTFTFSFLNLEHLKRGRRFIYYPKTASNVSLPPEAEGQGADGINPDPLHEGWFSTVHGLGEDSRSMTSSARSQRSEGTSVGFQVVAACCSAIVKSGWQRGTFRPPWTLMRCTMSGRMPTRLLCVETCLCILNQI